MKSHTFFRSTVLLAAIALAVPVFAKPVSKTINLVKASKIGKADLASGEYRLLIDENKATVMKGNKMIVETQGRWEERSNKSEYDSVLLAEDGQLKEVRFAGQKRVFVLSE
jgi:hypothetical protein